MARYGINVADVMDVIEHSVGGESATEILEGNRRFAVTVRVVEEIRSSPEAIGRLLVPAPSGALVALSQVAHVTLEEAPPTISREQGQRNAPAAGLTHLARGL